MKQGVMPSTLLSLILALFLLIVFSLATGTITNLYEKYFIINKCTATIESLHRMPSPLSGKGIQCPTRTVEYGSDKGGIQAFIGRQMAQCAAQYGSFERDPFHGARSHTICTVCAKLSASEFQDLDVALLAEQKEGDTAYAVLTGRKPTTATRSILKKVDDNFVNGEYAIVWVRNGEGMIDQWLEQWGMERTGRVWSDQLLTILPGENVQPNTGNPIIGGGRGIFSPSGEGLSQAILFIAQKKAEEQGCIELDKESWKPVE